MPSRLAHVFSNAAHRVSRSPHRPPWVPLALCAMVLGCSATRDTSPDHDADPGPGRADSGASRERGVPDGGVVAEGGPETSFASDPFQGGDASLATGMATQCPPGTYEGSFECDFVPAQSDGGAGTYPVSGSVAITFEKASGGEFLEVVDGEFEATAQTFYGLRARLTGELQCGSGEFEATTEGGKWALGDPAMPVVPGGMFQAELMGTLSGESPPTIEGVWTLDDPMFGHCDGTWSVQKTP